MTSYVVARDRRRLLSGARAGNLEVVAAQAAACVLVVYLGLRGGGFDPVVRGEVGVVVWWAVLLGSVSGLLPLARASRVAWFAVALLTAFAAWTALSVIWTESQERTVADLGKVAAYAGVLVLAVSVAARGHGRALLGGVATGIGVIAVLAVLSRLAPSWFPAQDHAAFLPTTARRLAYPLNYWNALAALMAIGIPLVLLQALTARHLLTQALAAGSVPVLVLCAWLTGSRGGALAAGAAIVALIALFPRRLSLLATVAVCGAGSALVVVASSQRPDVERAAVRSLSGDAATLLIVLAIVCVGVALLRVALALVERYVEPPMALRVAAPGRRGRLVVTLLAGMVAVVVALAAGLPQWVGDQWTEFKQPIPERSITTGDPASRFATANGNGRYQLWESAIDAYETRPWGGIGSGTFEFWWARHGSEAAFVRDAHSLYVETLAELGLIGFGILLAFLVVVVVRGVERSRVKGPWERQATAAAGTAAVVAFAMSAALDWTWEIAVVPVSVLVVAAAVLTLGGGEEPGLTVRPRVARLVVVGLAIAAMVAVVVPLSGTAALRESERLVTVGQLDRADAEAISARRVQPYAGSPRLQEALIDERLGRFDAARVAALQATRREPTNWRTWFILARIEAARGDARAALSAYDRAKALNPRSGIFTAR
ncbi:MAG TPA: O-antigen ligase family protein [Capillimicrobium sp.]|nr:O-antigen ligase family protein [Capillimicrobium sp.]